MQTQQARTGARCPGPRLLPACTSAAAWLSGLEAVGLQAALVREIVREIVWGPSIAVPSQKRSVGSACCWSGRSTALGGFPRTGRLLLLRGSGQLFCLERGCQGRIRRSGLRRNRRHSRKLYFAHRQSIAHRCAEETLEYNERLDWRKVGALFRIHTNLLVFLQVPHPLATAILRARSPTARSATHRPACAACSPLCTHLRLFGSRPDVAAWQSGPPSRPACKCTAGT